MSPAKPPEAGEWRAVNWPEYELHGVAVKVDSFGSYQGIPLVFVKPNARSRGIGLPPERLVPVGADLPPPAPRRRENVTG